MRKKSRNIGQEQKVHHPSTEVLEEFDATALVGLRVVVHNAAIRRIDEQGDESIEVPNPANLMATAAVVRCLSEVKLRGPEIRAIRKIMGFSLECLAKRLGEKTAIETLSRWETEKQPIGGYAEKVLRLLVCEELRKQAPGVSYDASMIANLRVVDPWILDPTFEAPPLHLSMVRVKECSGGLIDAYDEQPMAA